MTPSPLSSSPSLDELSRKYVLDKHISTSWHNYIPIYAQLFEPKRLLPLRLLEIGIGVVEHGQMIHTKDQGYQTGNSLRCWRDYFPFARVYGIDIHPTSIRHEPRIKTFVANQSNTDDLTNVVRAIGRPLDIVIDDGSHQLADQVASFTFLSRHMAPQGLYIIEDIQRPHQEGFKNLSVFTPDVQDYIRTSFDVCPYETGHRSPMDDDFLMVFIKK